MSIWADLVADDVQRAPFFRAQQHQRYSVGTKSKDLKFAADGSVTISMSNETPADTAQSANWLPTPKGDFLLYIRSYWPEAAITEGKWTPPPIEQAK
jgi:hypothetical protein